MIKEKYMLNNNSNVASVDINRYIDGLEEMVEMYVNEGFEPYMIGFMFRLSLLNKSASGQIIESEIRRVYSRFLTEIVRYPWSKGNIGNRPILIACRDWPVGKGKKAGNPICLPHEGVHAGGILLVPPRNNLKTGVKDHFEAVKRKAYVRRGFPLSRIHIQHMDHPYGRAIDYSFKSLKRRRCTFADVIFLPDSQSERPNRGANVRVGGLSG
jgi:hypothetical protein